MGAIERLESFRQLLAHARQRLGLDIEFVLWDGSTVPDDLAPDAFAVSLADEGVVASLTRRPSLETLTNLWVSGRIDLRNGTIFDLVRNRPKVRTREFRKTLDKWLTARTLLKFLFVPRGGPWPLNTVPDEHRSDGSPEQNKKNIHYHYDVSNAFYRLFLDERMVYSCGYFTDWRNDIDQAQADKLEMICRKLRLKPGDRLLDIGCGWGALVIYATTNYGVTAHGVTLSENQILLARERVAEAGLGDRITLDLTDFSQLDGEYDKIASIGMFEHVGIENYPTYYRTVNRVLKEDGLFLHHAITGMPKKDQKTFRKKSKEKALLTKYIFPGGELDHIGNTVTMLEQHGFEVQDVENWPEHYQRTCKHWHDRLLDNYDAAVTEVGETKTRLWLLYLGGSSIAFERNTAAVYQTLVSKRHRGPSGLPPTRADLYR